MTMSTTNFSSANSNVVRRLSDWGFHYPMISTRFFGKLCRKRSTMTTPRYDISSYYLLAVLSGNGGLMAGSNIHIELQNLTNELNKRAGAFRVDVGTEKPKVKSTDNTSVTTDVHSPEEVFKDDTCNAHCYS